MWFPFFRIRPLSADERQEIKTIENLGNKLVHNFSGSSSETIQTDH